MLIWLEFGICLAVIALAGYRLCRYGDVIAEKTGLTGSWVGVALLATVTSLPELFAGISSVTVAQVPNIAVGNVFGACLLNLFFIVVLDFFLRGDSLYSRITQGHILAATLGVVMIGFAGFSILIANFVGGWRIFHVGISTPVVILLYVIAIRMIYQYERGQASLVESGRPASYEHMTLKHAITGYVISGAVVVLAAIWLPFVARELSELMGWSQSFVGTLLVAAATTAPEAAVTLSALRIGALDMALANLFGSNLFNIMILAIDDLFYTAGPLWVSVSPVHALSAVTAVMMSGVAITGLFLRASSRLFRTVGWASLVLMALYVLNSYLLYLHGD